MMVDNDQNYIFKLALSEDIFCKSMIKLLADFNIHGLNEDKAMKLFYSILAHTMYYLDTHPGQYFKLKFIDITSDKDNLLCVKRGSEYTEDTVNPEMFYNRFCGTQVLKEELQHTLDLFAQSFLGIREEKRKEKNALDETLRRRQQVINEITQCTELAKTCTKQKKSVLAERKAEQKLLQKYANKNKRATFITPIEVCHFNNLQKQYQQLKEELILLYEQDSTSIPFKN